MSAPDPDKEPFFIGWGETPRPDRRFFLKAGIGLTAGSTAIAAGVAALQAPPGPGTWDQADVREWRGVVTNEPYAMLHTRDIDGSPRTALLACLGKCGVTAQIGAMAGQYVAVTGSLIQRGRHSMIAVNELGEWMRPLAADAPEGLDFPTAQDLGAVSLAGEILDSKCWFGAMRPSEGKVHKTCASLCIRGGIPPAFFTRGPSGRGGLVLLTDAGRAQGPDLLPLVADPVRVQGSLRRMGDLLLLDAAPAKFVRL